MRILAMCCGVLLSTTSHSAATQLELSTSLDRRTVVRPNSPIDFSVDVSDVGDGETSKLAGWQLNIRIVRQPNAIGELQLTSVGQPKNGSPTDSWLFSSSIEMDQDQFTAFGIQFPFAGGHLVSTDAQALVDVQVLPNLSFGAFHILSATSPGSVWTDAGLPTQLEHPFVNDVSGEEFLLTELFVTTPGDSTLDGKFNSEDLITVFRAGHYEDSLLNNSTWETGDWNGDREFDTADLIAALQAGRYEATAHVVPECHATPAFLLIVCLAASSIRRSPTRAIRPERKSFEESTFNGL